MDIFNEVLNALMVTVFIAVGAACLTWAIAIALGLAKTSRYRIVSIAGNVVAELSRGTSCYVLMFWLYFILPFFGVRLDAVFVGIVAIGLNAGAYGSEVVRGAIKAVPTGLREAAIALNFSNFDTARYVILPNAVVRMLPPMCNIMVDILKVTPLVSLITVADLTFVAQLYRQASGNPILAFSALLVAYYVLSSGVIYVFKKLESSLVKGFSGTRRV